MAAIPTLRQLADMNDSELDSPAVGWRAQAGRGDRNAFGIAHAREVERRRRIRDRQIAQLTPAPPAALRRWWQFWRELDHGSKETSHV